MTNKNCANPLQALRSVYIGPATLAALFGPHVSDITINIYAELLDSFAAIDSPIAFPLQGCTN